MVIMKKITALKDQPDRRNDKENHFKNPFNKNKKFYRLDIESHMK